MSGFIALPKLCNLTVTVFWRNESQVASCSVGATVKPRYAEEGFLMSSLERIAGHTRIHVLWIKLLLLLWQSSSRATLHPLITQQGKRITESGCVNTFLSSAAFYSSFAVGIKIFNNSLTSLRIALRAFVDDAWKPLPLIPWIHYLRDFLLLPRFYLIWY